MTAFKKLRYEDEEGLVVVINQHPSNTDPSFFLAVSHNGSLALPRAVVFAHDVKTLQVVAHLLVGIEIQEDGATWKRGPRAPAAPTGSDGVILTPRERFDARRDEKVTSHRAFEYAEKDCLHRDVIEIRGKAWCFDCGMMIGARS